MLAKIIDILNSELKCPICLDNFQNPSITQCGHSFCYECIKSLTQLEINQKQILCPLCKRQLNFKDVILNKKINDIQSQIKLIKNDSQIPKSEYIENSIFKKTNQQDNQFKSELSKKPSINFGQNMVLLSSGLKQQISDDFEKFQKKFKCSVVEEYSDQVTHLITGYDISKQNILFGAKRTVKFLQCLVKGIVHSLLSNQILNEQDFEIEDDGYSKSKPKLSRLNGGMKNLFKDYEFKILHQNNNNKNNPLNKNDLMWLIQECGGQIVNSKLNENTFLIKIQNQTDQKGETKQQQNEIVSHLWILNSISNFQILDVEDYYL